MVVDTIGPFHRDLHRQLPYAPIPTCCMSWSVSKLTGGGETMEVLVTVEDPGTFTVPWSGIQRFRARAGGADRGGHLRPRTTHQPPSTLRSRRYRRRDKPDF